MESESNTTSAKINRRVDAYSVDVRSNYDVMEDSCYNARITLHEKIAEGNHVAWAYLDFYSQNVSPLPKTQVKGQVYASYYLSELDSILNILRNERPIKALLIEPEGDNCPVHLLLVTNRIPCVHR